MPSAQTNSLIKSSTADCEIFYYNKKTGENGTKCSKSGKHHTMYRWCLLVLLLPFVSGDWVSGWGTVFNFKKVDHFSWCCRLTTETENSPTRGPLPVTSETRNNGRWRRKDLFWLDYVHFRWCCRLLAETKNNRKWSWKRIPATWCRQLPLLVLPPVGRNSRKHLHRMSANLDYLKRKRKTCQYYSP